MEDIKNKILDKLIYSFGTEVFDTVSEEDLNRMEKYYKEIKEELLENVDNFAILLSMVVFGYNKDGGVFKSEADFTGGDALEQFDEEVYDYFYKSSREDVK